jgi:hypothetical protein
VSFRNDHLFGLLRGFRADEARIDDAIRSRIWAQITDADPEAADWLDTLDRGARVRQIRRRAPRPSQILAVAAVLVLLAAAQMVVRSGPSEEPSVSAGPSTTVPIPHDLDELADRVAIERATVLGETEDTRYTYQRGVRSTQLVPTVEATTSFEQRWIADDGSGREVIDVEGSDRDPEVYVRNPGYFNFGSLTPPAAVALPDDAGAVLDSLTRDAGAGAGDTEKALALVDLLTYAGVPGPARAGALRALDRLGFEPAPGPDPAPNLWRVEGTGPDGSTMRVDFDLLTGEVAAWTRLLRGGGFMRLTNIEIDLRRDTQGS